MNREIKVSIHLKRIISLVPSQTELLYDLGLDERVVGITKFCIYPASWYRNKTRVGGTKNIDFNKIEELNPDLIIANKEENEEQQLKILMQKYPVWISDISNMSEAKKMINSVGEITNTVTLANQIVTEIYEQFDKLTPHNHLKKTLYLIWKNPYMAAGKSTFIDDMLTRCGMQNGVLLNRYPALTLQEIKKINPEVVLLSSEPYPFREKHIEELEIALPNAKIKLVDGELFSWYGSRLLKSPNYFQELLATI